MSSKKGPLRLCPGILDLTRIFFDLACRKNNSKTLSETKTNNMGNFIQKIISSWSQQPTKIVMVGLDAAGKTTILYKLKLGEVITTARKKTNGKVHFAKQHQKKQKLTTLLSSSLLLFLPDPTTSHHWFQRRIGHVQKIRHDRVGHWGTGFTAQVVAPLLRKRGRRHLHCGQQRS